MIRPLPHTQPNVALAMQEVFQASYTVEAQLLQAENFPPLQRPLEGYTQSTNDFYGYYQNDALAGVIEIATYPTYLHIQSLVVHPSYFRQGIGKALTTFALASYDAPLYIVETGAANAPAIALYESLGFVLVEEWDTEFGVRKVKLERKRD